MRKLITLFSLSLLIWSCQKQQVDFTDKGEIIGLGSPIMLQSDTTEVFLGDYFMNPEEVISIAGPNELNFYHDKANQRLVLWSISGSLPPLSALELKTTAGGIYHIILQASDKLKAEFRLKDQNFKQVQVKGEMNAWNPLTGEMSLGTDGYWSIELESDPGVYQYIFVADGREMLDPENPDVVDNNIGGFNSLLRLGGPTPSRRFLLTKDYNQNRIRLETDAEDLQLFCLWENQLIPANVEDGFISIPLHPGMSQKDRSHVRVFAYSGNTTILPLQIPLHQGKVLDQPEQLSRRDKERTIMYFLMVDRFVNGQTENDEPVNHPEIHPKANHFGGDIAGVIEKIKDGYFEQMGMNTIWLSPIVQNAQGAWGAYPKPFTRFSGYHGYWPVSFNSVDYRFGTAEELKELVAEAHKRDMNVLLDFVANHVHEDHPYYRANPQVATNLYLPDGSLNTERWDDHRLTTWFDVFMPTLDLERMEVTEMLSDSAVFWLKEFQIDGFRHDATKHIPQVFWRTLTRKIKEQVVIAESRPVLQIGETYGSPELISSYISSGMLDSQFDFNLYDDIVATFARPETPMSRLRESLEKSFRYYGQHNLMGNMTGNQDRARFMAYADGSLRFDEDAKYVGWTREISVQDTSAYSKLQSLNAFQMSIPGIPVVYYGDEYGMTGAGDPDNRRMMQFEGLNTHENKTRDITAKLTKWRTEHLPLMLGQTLFLSESDEILVFARIYFEQMVVVAFNKSAKEQQIEIEIPGRNFNQRSSFSGRGSNWDGNRLQLSLPAGAFELISNK